MTAAEQTYREKLRGLSDEKFARLLRTPRKFEPAFNKAAADLAEMKRRGWA